MKAIILVGTGGFIGSALRYLFSGWIFAALDKPWFPAGTMAVNVIGCLLIGFLGGLFEHHQIFVPEIRLFVFVGVLGGFTTFSAFAYETAGLLRDGYPFGAWMNVGLQIFAGLAAVWIGGMISRLT